MITLRDMGMRPKDLIAACKEAGVKMTNERAGRIINGTTMIKPAEMEVIAKMLNKTVDEMYIDLGSVISIGSPLECEYWDWEKWCRRKIMTNGRRRIDMYTFKRFRFTRRS